MFSWFEAILRPTAPPPPGYPPNTLGGFYWHFVRQSRGLVVALFAAGMLTAVLDSLIPVFIGRVVNLVGQQSPATLWADRGDSLLGMAAVLLVARPAALSLQYLVTNQAIAPGMTNLVRWQSHWHVVRQSWTFFQNDFAGRIANRVSQVGPSLRESVVAATNAVWYIIVYGGSAILLLAHADGWLAVPLVLWFCAYAGMLRVFVPRMRERSRKMSEVRSTLTGRVVDSYTNILTVKLFARARDEDAHVAEAVDDHTATFQRQQRLISALSAHARGAERLAGGRHRIGRGGAVDARGGLGRLGGDGAAAGVAVVQHSRLGGAERHRHLRERRHRAGRNALDRGAAAAPGPDRRAAAQRRRRGDPCSTTSASATAPSAACCTTSTCASAPASASA